jgi:biotin-dependent carboxylase-like uncharacterized protein
MTGPMLVATAPANFTSVQDMGRTGWRRFGLTGAGAMDPESLACANALVGNPIAAAAIEFAHAGGEWQVRGADCRIAITGGGFDTSINGEPLQPNASTVLRQGHTLKIGGARDAVWGYLAVAGGVLVAREFGSRSTHVRSGVGGLQGRFLQAGDELKLASTGAPIGAEHTLSRPPLPRDAPIRVVLGPQDDYFTQAAITKFLSTEYRVTWQGDRMGYRLEGPPLEHAGGFNIVSDGLLPGSIQVPGNGQPIVLLMDAQTTGGYPKIATIVSADVGRFAQHRPGRTVRFAAVDLDDAQLLRREFIYRLQATRLRLAPMPP